MSRRIAYRRPRYQHLRGLPRPSFHSHKEFLHYRWMYRQQPTRLAKPTPGQSLLLIPWGYRLTRRALAISS